MAEGGKISIPQKPELQYNSPEHSEQEYSDKTAHPAPILQRAMASSQSLRPADLMQLQKTIGNRAVMQMMKRSTCDSGHETVQRKMIFEPAVEYLDCRKNTKIKSPIYIEIQKEAHESIMDFDVLEGEKNSFSPDIGGAGGKITVLKPADEKTKTKDESDVDFNIALQNCAHETQHAIDFGKNVKSGASGRIERTLKTEWNAWASEAAVAKELNDRDKKVSYRGEEMFQSYKNMDAFKKKDSLAWVRTKIYMDDCKEKDDPDHKKYDTQPDAVTTFITDHKDWIEQSIDLFYRRIGQPRT